jgi:hypothetical protein
VKRHKGSCFILFGAKEKIIYLKFLIKKEKEYPLFDYSVHPGTFHNEELPGKLTEALTH